MTRVLPGVYGSIFDNSQLPEGQGVLTVGYVLACNKGTVGEPFLVTSPSDFLQKTTLSGKPPIKGDPTFTTILNVLQQTNQVYISRVAVNPLYGGVVVKRDYLLGDVTSIANVTVPYIDPQSNVEYINEPRTEITVKGELQVGVKAGDTVRLYGTDNIDGRYKVVSVAVPTGSENTVITVEANITESILDTTGFVVELYKTQQPQPITKEDIGEITGIDKDEQQITLAGNCENYVLQGDQVVIQGNATYNGTYTVATSGDFDIDNGVTTFTVVENLSADYVYDENNTITLYRGSIANPEYYGFKPEDLCLFYGKDQGAYNSDLAINIVSYAESPEELAESGTIQVTPYNAQTGVALGNPFLCSRSETAYSIAGEPLYIEQVINGNSEYIRVLNNQEADEDLLPCDTVEPVTYTFKNTDKIQVEGVTYYNMTGNVYGLIRDNQGNITGYITGYQADNADFGGGSDGDTIVKTNSVPFISALEGFKDKTIPVSILGNGWCEEEDYQQTLISIAGSRLDCFVFLNSPASAESAQLPSTRATNIVNYKKGKLGSTTYMASMYAPHVTAVDTLNQRKVKLGAEAVAIPGWLNIINTKGYPYAYAGYDDGAVTGVTTQWKIGDQSGEAQAMNDASINYVAYDAKDGVYYMQCQNTLQIANSALRNIGTVLNILDIKETFMKYFKPFIQKPITDTLRGRILDGGREQVNLYIAQGRITNGVLQDVSTDLDISNNTLRYLLTIAPTPYAQVIYLQMNIVNQTYDFSILQSV